jgi:hypothetical protein
VQDNVGTKLRLFLHWSNATAHITPPTAIKRQSNVDNMVKCFFVFLEGCVSLKPFFRLQFVTQNKTLFILWRLIINIWDICIILRENPNARDMAKCYRIFKNDSRRWQYYCLFSDREILTFILIMWIIGRASNSIQIYSYIQQDATLHSLFISGNCATCFGW